MKPMSMRGRPEARAFITSITMFGQQFGDIYSSYYASFTHAKVVGFHDGLEELKYELPPIDEFAPEEQGLPQFLDDLIDLRTDQRTRHGLLVHVGMMFHGSTGKGSARRVYCGECPSGGNLRNL